MSIEHLQAEVQALIETMSKVQHLVTKSDILPEDKMNYECAKKMCSEKIQDLSIIDVNNCVTIMYLKIMNFLSSALLKKGENSQDRLCVMWYSVFVCRIWRQWIKKS